MQELCDPDTATVCHACAWTIDYMFTKYDSYTSYNLEYIFEILSQRAAYILYTEDYDMSGVIEDSEYLVLE
jgi:hypothetical protein